jgi:hypothetical protein
MDQFLEDEDLQSLIQVVDDRLTAVVEELEAER